MKKIIAVMLITVSSMAVSGTLVDKFGGTMATIINLNGHLCATVTGIYPLKIDNIYEVRCIQYRGGGSQVTYIVNALSGVAYKS